jgi:inosine-uridine nucleoside N-ribohydrolase
MRILWLVLLPALLAAQTSVIFDTDMGNDCDDAQAQAILHALETRKEIRLLAITVTKDQPLAAAMCERIADYYKYPGIPVGLVRDGKTKDVGKFLGKLNLKPKASYDDALDVLEKTLRAQPDNSVVVIMVGFSTNMARLLERPGGKDLIAKKVKWMSAMAGAFPSGKKEYNVYIDIPAARKVFADWPTPIVFSGFEIGLALKYPAVSIIEDYMHTPNNPAVEAYKLYEKFPHDRPTWDLTSVLYAARPNRGYFGLSGPGDVSVDDEGKTIFKPNPKANRRYLTLDAVQAAKTLEALMLLSSQPFRQ